MKSLLAVLLLAVACAAQTSTGVAPITDPCQIPQSFLDVVGSFSTALSTAQAAGTLNVTPTPGANLPDALAGAKYLYASLWYYKCTTDNLRLSVADLKSQMVAMNSVMQGLLPKAPIAATVGGTSTASGTLMGTGTTAQTQGSGTFPWFTGANATVGLHSLGDPAYQWSGTTAACPGGVGCSATKCQTAGGDNACAYKNTSIDFAAPDHGSGSYPGSKNQCVIDGYAGSTSLAPVPSTDPRYYAYGQQCPSVSAQSGGTYDPYRHHVLRFGGGHLDYFGTDIFMVDLTAQVPTLKRVKDPIFPANTTKANPLIGTKFGALTYLPNLGPEDTNKPTFPVTFNGNGTNVTVTCVLPCASPTPSQTLFNPLPVNGTPDGKPIFIASGTTNYNGNFLVGTYISPTSFSYASTANAGIQTGTITGVPTNCFTAADGSGCSPVSRHTTAAFDFYPGTTTAGVIDHTQDAIMGASGAIGPTGASVKDTLLLNLNAPMNQASTADWVAANRRSDFHPAKGTYPQPYNFGSINLYDTASRMSFFLDEISTTFWAYDLFGDGGTRTPNTWYKQAANFAGVSGDYKSGAITNNSANGHSILTVAGGCRRLELNTISQTGNAVTAATTATTIANSWIAGYSHIYIYNVVDNSFNSGDGTNDYLTLQTVSGSNLTFNSPASRTASSTGGYALNCDSLSNVEAHDNQGVAAADISNIPAVIAGSITSQRWNTNTLARNNLDTGNPALGNTCAEFLGGGKNPLWMQGLPNNGFLQNPAMDVDTSVGKNTSGQILAWPQEGLSLYAILPDPVNSRITCKRFDYTAQDAWAVPVSGNEMSGSNRTSWGDYRGGKAWYDSDMFFIWPSHDQGIKYFALQR